jgi:hypothetical protein
MNDPFDVGQCRRCGRWHRRRHAYVDEFGPGDLEEWCVTGGCFETWKTGVVVMLHARHDRDLADCCCAECRAASGATPDSTALEWAADHGMSGVLDEDELDHRKV